MFSNYLKGFGCCFLEQNSSTMHVKKYFNSKFNAEKKKGEIKVCEMSVN